MPNKVGKYEFKIKVTADGGTTYTTSVKTIDVKCGPGSARAIEDKNFGTEIQIEKTALFEYTFKPFTSSNSQCKVTGYEVTGDEIEAITVQNGCSAPPCNVLIFDTALLKK